MKQIISKLKKCLCLTLSIFLLTSNIQVFGQEVLDNSMRELLYKFSTEAEIVELNVQHLNFLLREEIPYVPLPDPEATVTADKCYVSFESTVRGIDKGIKNFYEIEDKIMSRVKIPLTSKETVDIVVDEKYFNGDLTMITNSLRKIREQDEIIIKKLISITEEFRFWRNIKFHHSPVKSFTMPDLISGAERAELEGCLSYLRNRFSKGSLIRTVEDFQLYEKDILNPKKILEYAYKNGMLPKEKAGVKLTLQAMDADVSVNSLVKSIRQYLTDFSTKIKDVKYYPEESLLRELQGMTVAERTEYVDELIELQPGSKEFIKDFNRIDRPAQRYIRKNIIHGTWVSIGLIAGLTLLFELIPQNSNANNINKSLEIMDALDDITYKIENGEATMPEMLYFYTIPENESLILNDPVHTLNFVKLTESVMAAEEILEAEKEIREQETKATTENVENSILQRYMEMQQNKKVNVGNVNVADFSF